MIETLALRMLPLSYLLCSILCVAWLAALGAERRFRGLILIPLTLLVAVVAWQFGDAPSSPLPGGGVPVAWAWFPLAAAWLAALGGPAGSRILPVAVLLLAGLSVWGFAPVAAPATTLALAVHRTLAVGLAAVALAALARLCIGFPERQERERWRFLSALSGGMLLGLVLALAYLYFVQPQPLGLDLRIALTVLPAETIAAFCVYRGVHTVAQPNTEAPIDTATQPGDGGPADSAESSGGRMSAARATALLVLFVLAGGGLGLVPIILNGATRLSE